MKFTSYRPEVIADSSGNWIANALRFATREEAEAQVLDLALRWTAVRDTRVVETDLPASYSYVDGKLTPVPTNQGISDATAALPGGGG